MEFQELIQHAESVYGSRKIARNAWAGSVSAALLAGNGSIYTGICLDVCSGMGFCAEHAAIATMISAGESRIMQLVAIGKEGIIPPCGRCRELIHQIHDENWNTEIMISYDQVVFLRNLLPYPRTI